MKLFYRGGLTAVLVAGVMFAGGVAEAASPSAQKVCVNRATGVMRFLRQLKSWIIRRLPIGQ